MEISLKDIIPEIYLKEDKLKNDNIENDNIDNGVIGTNDVIYYNGKKITVEKAIFTTVIRVKGSKFFNVVPIKTNKSVSMNMWIDISKALSRLRVGPPLRIGDVLCKNILNTGVDIVCTRNINKD